MEMLRVTYRSQMRPYRDRPDVTVAGRWQFCPEGALPLPFPHLFGSARMLPNTPADADLGETTDRGTAVRSRTSSSYTGLHFCGTAEQWQDGVYYADRGTTPVDVDGIPVCCQRPDEPLGGIDLCGVATWTIPVEGGVSVSGGGVAQGIGGGSLSGGGLLAPSGDMIGGGTVSGAYAGSVRRAWVIGEVASDSSPASLTITLPLRDPGHGMTLAFIAWRYNVADGPLSFLDCQFGGFSLEFENYVDLVDDAGTGGYGGAMFFYPGLLSGDDITAFAGAAGGNVTDLTLQVIEVRKLFDEHVDFAQWTNSDTSGTSTTPNAGGGGLATDTYTGALVVTLGPVSDGDGTWGDGMEVQSVVGTANVRASVAGVFWESTLGFNAGKTGITPRPWAALAAGFAFF